MQNYCFSYITTIWICTLPYISIQSKYSVRTMTMRWALIDHALGTRWTRAGPSVNMRWAYVAQHVVNECPKYRTIFGHSLNISSLTHCRDVHALPLFNSLSQHIRVYREKKYLRIFPFTLRYFQKFLTNYFLYIPKLYLKHLCHTLHSCYQSINL